MTTTVATALQGEHGPMPAIIDGASSTAGVGVLIVVGGPQYRVGSHRQFTLLSRALAADGIPVMRFDYQGMGDAAGPLKDFTGIDEDIRIAIDCLVERQGLERVVLWGLCDAASAALVYAWRDPRVCGMVLLNPWVRTEQSLARARLRMYYGGRLLAPAFWKKLGRGEFHWRRSLRALAEAMMKACRSGARRSSEAPAPERPLPDRMAHGLREFQGPTLFLLSGNDLTAAEFRDTVRNSRSWAQLVDRDDVEWQEFPAADHTFSRREWRDQVADATRDWVQRLR